MKGQPTWARRVQILGLCRIFGSVSTHKAPEGDWDTKLFCILRHALSAPCVAKTLYEEHEPNRWVEGARATLEADDSGFWATLQKEICQHITPQAASYHGTSFCRRSILVIFHVAAQSARPDPALSILRLSVKRRAHFRECVYQGSMRGRP